MDGSIGGKNENSGEDKGEVSPRLSRRLQRYGLNEVVKKRVQIGPRPALIGKPIACDFFDPIEAGVTS